MILVPASRWATRPVCATRPLRVATRAAVVPAPAVRRSTRPVCATRRLHDAPALVADIKWASASGLPIAA